MAARVRSSFEGRMMRPTAMDVVGTNELLFPTSSLGQMRCAVASLPTSPNPSTVQAVAPPPSSFKDPLTSSYDAMLVPNDSSSNSGGSAKRRPRSTEIGQKAKEAMMDFGRVARDLPRGIYNLRNLSRSDVSNSQSAHVPSQQAPHTQLSSAEGHEESAAFSPSMDDTDNLIPTFSSPMIFTPSERRSSRPTSSHSSQPRRSTAKAEETMSEDHGVGLGLRGLDGQISTNISSNSGATAAFGPRAQPIRSPNLRASRRSSLQVPSPANSVPKQLSNAEQLFGSPQKRVISIQPPQANAPVQIKLDTDHVEIGLDDVRHDSPIFRAALQSAEKRTANVRRAAKGIVKAAEECVASIEALCAAESRLDCTFDEMTSVLPASFGLLYVDMLEDARKKDVDHWRELKGKLNDHIILPMRALTDMCREVAGHLKAFEGESKTYYSATQKWLSSRSSAPNQATGNATSNAEMYSPDAVGYDKGAQKQEKLDEKQRLRQMRFELARFEVYRDVCSLHAGEAEMLVASHLLALCRSQCRGREAQATMHTYSQAMKEKHRYLSEDADKVRLSCQEMEARILELQRSTAREIDGPQGEVRSNTEAETSNVAASRNKVRSILASFGVASAGATSSDQHVAQRAPLSCPIPPVEAFEISTSHSPIPAATKQTNFHAQDEEEFGVPIEKSEPSSASKWQSRLRSFSFSKQQQHHRDGNGDGRNLLGRGTAQQEHHQSPLPHTTDSHYLCEISKPDQASRTQRRSMSFSETKSPVKPLHVLQASAESTFDRCDDVSTGGEDQVRTNGGEMLPPSPTLQRNGTGRSTHVPGQPSRKKEGILWSLTKPIQGAAGADAPRAVSRSQNWRECWVVLSGSGHLGEYAHWKDAKAAALESSQPLIDLRFATVREARGVERRFTFEIVTREYRRFFQASNEEEMRGWIVAIGMAIESLINGTSSVRQVDKVARMGMPVAQGDFGMRHVFESTSPSFAGGALGIRTAFSQSMTDLGSSAGARLFHRGERTGVQTRDEPPRAGKRDSRQGPVNLTHGHLSALSEGGGHLDADAEETLLANDVYDPIAATPVKGDQHSRGISNTTPVSGYIGSHAHQNGPYRAGKEQVMKGEHLASSSSLDITTEYDKRIEAMVNSSYGGGDAVPLTGIESSSGPSSGFVSHGNHRDSMLSSVTPSRGPSSCGGPISADEEGRLQTSSTSSSFNHGERSNKFSRAREILAIAMREGNRVCADCRRPDPRWASWCLHGERRCIFICIACSGVHRGLGVSVSKVRSVDLDDWTEEQLQAAREWGNDRVNALYEARKPSVCTVSSMGDTRTKAFWMAKYTDRSWFWDGQGHQESLSYQEESRTTDEEEAHFKHAQDSSVQGVLKPRKRRPTSLGVISQASSSASPLQSSGLSNRMPGSASPFSSSSKSPSQARWSSANIPLGQFPSSNRVST